VLVTETAIIHHVKFGIVNPLTFNAGTVTLYLNGSQTSQHTGIPNPIGYSNIAWGSYRYNNAVAGQYLHPQTIGPTLLYNRALSSTEVLQNFNGMKGRYGIK